MYVFAQHHIPNQINKNSSRRAVKKHGNEYAHRLEVTIVYNLNKQFEFNSLKFFKLPSAKFYSFPCLRFLHHFGFCQAYIINKHHTVY